jgi:hypothetical protein
MKTKSLTKKSRKLVSKRSPLSAAKRRRQGYPIHKRLLLHPLSLFGILCVGVLITGWTYRALADTVISSVVEATPLQTGAMITYPTDGSLLQTSPIDVSGSCPVNSYVELYLNGVFDGVAWCSSGDTFTIETSLFSGVNTLLVEDFNTTDQQGPATPSIGVTFNPPSAQTTPASSDTTTQASTTPDVTSATQTVLPLLLASDFHFQTFSQSKVFTWPLDLEGGTPPYTVHVVWGDGTSSILHFDTDPVFNLTHTYKSAGYYAVVAIAADSKNQQKVFQMAALVTNAHGTLPGVSTRPALPKQQLFSNISTVVSTQKWLFLAWPAYIVVFLMAVSFWLGERRQFSRPKPRKA